MTLHDLLRRIASGDLTAEEAAPRVRAFCLDAVETPSTTEQTQARMAGALDDRDATDSFLEVSAAWMGGTLTDAQYAVLYEAVSGRPFMIGGGDRQ